MFALDIFRQLRQQVHVLGKTHGDVGLHDFEHTPFPLPGVWVPPGKSHHRADAGFEEDVGLDLNLISRRGPSSSTMIARTCSASISEIPFSSSVSERRKRGCRCRFLASTWPSFCRPGTLAISLSKTRAGRRVRGKLHLFDELGGETLDREVQKHEQHGVLNQRAPVRIFLGNQIFCGQALDHPALRSVRAKMRRPDRATWFRWRGSVPQKSGRRRKKRRNCSGVNCCKSRSFRDNSSIPSPQVVCTCRQRPIPMIQDSLRNQPLPF